MPIDDTNRLLALTTPLGDGVLSPVAFHAEEQISAPYSLSVDAVSTQAAIAADTLLFKPVSLSVTHDTQVRLFHGMVRAMTASGLPVRDMYRYTLSIVPRLWFMGQTADCRIFQQVTASDVLTTLCGEAGQTLQLKLFGSLPTLDYVTQYNETDLHFVSRLMEEAGLYYYFTHTTGDHTLVVTDSNSGFQSSPSPVLAVVHAGENIDTLVDWRQVSSTSLGVVQLMDYDPANPSQLPDATTTSTLDTSGAANRDVMRWPALSVDPSVVTARSKLAVQAADAAFALTDAAGSNHTLMPGGRFTLLRDPFTGAGSVPYVVRAVSHHGTDESWTTGSGEPDYSNTLSAFPYATTWRQGLTARRPVMAGIFGAIVLGAAGEEIHADSLGRIKVRLFWDHRADTVAAQAVWVRVIQPWAGNSWGWQHLPRVGSEVAVAFMDGDPDRPVVVGGFYNANMVPPFAVTAEETKSGFRSRSTTQGATSNFSELSFDDKKGSELVYFHAEKDMTREVENNDSLTVSNTQTITVAKGRAATIQAGGDQLTVQSGDLTIAISTGAASMEAMKSITLKVGGNSITIDPSGITIKGVQVQVQAQASVQVQGPMVQVNADGMLVLKGGIVTVN